MTTPKQMERDAAAARRWLTEVSNSALVFESRWTMLALQRVDPGIAKRLREQRGLFDQAVVTGTSDQIEEQGSAMCRGYAAAVRALEAAATPDDAYLLGMDSQTGMRVAIGEQKAAVARVREIHGQGVVWITPDEVAKLMGSVEAFKFVGAVKKLFPGAEVIDRYPDEPAKADAEEAA